MSRSVTSEIHVSRLMQGDAYEPSTRMHNISSAMAWIQEQLKELKEADRTLVELFQRLEMDMSTIKSTPNSRGTLSITQVNGVSWNAKPSTTTPQSSLLTSVPELKAIDTINTTIYENVHQSQPALNLDIESGGSNSDSDSLDDFADTLGGDDDDEDVNNSRAKNEFQLQTQPQQLRIYNSQLSSDDNVSAGSRGSQNSGLASVGLQLPPSSESPNVQQRSRTSRKLSNDSGVQFSNLDTESAENGSRQGSTGSVQATTNSKTTEENQNSTSFADEIFAMLKM